MPQYQSFPDASGDSRTLDKLKALHLPVLAGRSFLDVGCNEGFFCGFAAYGGAQRSVGIDASEGFIARARQRFPRCEFHARSWDALPEGSFDVILLASALHYADDQAALIHRLAERLSADGVLVIELGIVSSGKSEWVEVQRGIDRRTFPTMPKLREVLAPYAWKWMGPSIAQDGDPVKRHVLHVSRRRPVAYLLMEPPAYGKSSLAKGLFPKAQVKIVSGDQLVGDVAGGRVEAPPALAEVIRQQFSPFRLDEVIQRTFEAGLGHELVALWAAHAGGGDFALDVYVPAAFHEQVDRFLRESGYLPVRLNWHRPGMEAHSGEALDALADGFYLSLAGGGDQAPASDPQEPPRPHMLGYVDEISLNAGRLTVRGWAISPDNTLPSRLLVRIGDDLHVVEQFEKLLRPDVQRHLGLPHALFGYRLTLPLPELSVALLEGMQVFGDSQDVPFRRVGEVEAQLAAAR